MLFKYQNNCNFFIWLVEKLFFYLSCPRLPRFFLKMMRRIKDWIFPPIFQQSDLRSLKRIDKLIILKERNKCKQKSVRRRAFFFFPGDFNRSELEKTKMSDRKIKYLLARYNWGRFKISFLRKITQILPPCCYFLVSSLNRMTAIYDQKPVLISDYDKKVELDIKCLEECHREELKRKEIIENKARANLLSITVAISMMIAIGGLYFNSNFVDRIQECKFYCMGIFLFLGIAVFYFLCAGLLALSSFRTDKLYNIGLDDEASFLKEKEQNTTKKKELVKCVEQNKIVTNKRVLFVDASYMGIRNALIVLVLVFLFLCIVPFMNNTIDKKCQSTSQKSACRANFKDFFFLLYKGKMLQNH